MKAELFIRLYHIQEEKLDACLNYLECISRLFVNNIDDLPDFVKDKYIKITRPFIDRYNELLGQEGNYVEEEKE